MVWQISGDKHWSWPEKTWRAFSHRHRKNTLMELTSCKLFFLSQAPRPISHRVVGPSVRPSVHRSSHFAFFFVFLGILRVGKFAIEHAPAQIITAPAQLITTPAQPPATGVVVYTALLLLFFLFSNKSNRVRTTDAFSQTAPYLSLNRL